MKDLLDYSFSMEDLSVLETEFHGNSSGDTELVDFDEFLNIGDGLQLMTPPDVVTNSKEHSVTGDNSEPRGNALKNYQIEQKHAGKINETSEENIDLSTFLSLRSKNLQMKRSKSAQSVLQRSRSRSYGPSTLQTPPSSSSSMNYSATKVKRNPFYSPSGKVLKLIEKEKKKQQVSQESEK